ncbi:TonB-dependent receptor [Zhouia spongiae]|uniref:TonB-dependent receptor n=1 Tax=Zhouia spongiae TaxID=2202721 RepID=A0ABY3YI07_9FLAO|nr:TonB-dependent receptor [Zhouia spongiae]UNY97474.1 TonB-dependent receptor [Zhouia spongiae]
MNYRHYANEKTTRIGCFLLLFCLLTTSVFANSLFEDKIQSIVKGKVTDETGAPIPGVNVLLQGTSSGVATDFDGIYEIQVSGGNPILEFSYVGFVKQTVTVSGKSTINVVLKEDVSQLDEVVVVGYGTQKKANLTGAVSIVSSEALEDRPVTNFTSALQGTTSGLSITRASGQPGEESLNIQIRGLSSANGNVDPLIIIDGVPSSTLTLSQTLNPNDIESVSVLKDAAAAAIYGVQAAGGVILIKTKGGKAGKTKIDFSSQVSGSWAINLPERLSLLEEAEYSNLARANAGVGPEYSELDIERIKAGVQYVVNPNDPNRYIYYNTTDTRDVLLRDVSFMQTHNLRASGGSEKIKYLASMGYIEQDGVFKVGPDKFRRYNTRINLNAELTKHLNLDTKVSYAVHNRDQPSQGTNDYSFFQYINQDRGRYPIFTPEGRIAGGASRAYGTLKEGGYTDKEVNELDGIVTLTAKDFVKGLQIRSIYGRKFRTYDYENFKRTVALWGRFEPISYLNNPNSLTLYREIIEHENFQFLTDYDLNINKHNFHALLGYQWEDYRKDGINAFANNLVINDLPTLNIGERTSYNNTQNVITYATQSVFGRLNYNFDGKYLLEGTIRMDETSRLAPDSRVKWFPSASFGWNMHKENWFSSVLPYFNEFKPRVSWGQLGNANADIIGYYDYLPILQTGSGLVLGADEGRATYFYQNGVPSSTLAWETVETTNFGIDLGFLKNRFNITFDYYTKKNENMLIPLDLPGTFGVNAPRVNQGKLETKGWELTMNYKDQIGDHFNFNIGFNLSDSQNELVDYGEGRSIVRAGNNSLIQGYSVNTIWGYETVDGYIETQAQLDNAPFHNNRTGIGDIEYVDQNGDGVINQGGGTTDDPGDLVMLGSTQPRYFYGVNLAADYKNLDFSLFIQGVGKRSFMPLRDMIMPYAQSWFTAQKHHADYWTPDNSDAAFPRPYLGGTHNYVPSDRWVLDGSYVRIKNIQLGYSLSKKTLETVGISRFRVYASAENILTFTKLGVFEGVFDPEQRNNVRADYPVFAFAAFGVNLSF